MADEIKEYERKENLEKPLKESYNPETWREVPREQVLRDFKRHMKEVGPIVKYYKQKEREGIEKSRQRVIGC